MKKLKITLTILIALTIIATLISNNGGIYATFGVLFLAVLKFIGVSFFFMDLRKGHSFWKGSVLVFLLIFTTMILIII